MADHRDRFRSPRLSKEGKANFDAIDWSVKAPRAPQEAQIPPARSDMGFPMISSDYEAYECPVNGKMIEGRAAHEENLKVTGCRLHEKGEFEDVKKNGKKRMNEQIGSAVDKCVDEVAAMI